MDALDKLRNISRSAYNMEVTFDRPSIYLTTLVGIVLMQKARESLKSLSQQHASSKSITEIVSLLDGRLTEKAKTMEELAVLSETLAEPAAVGLCAGSEMAFPSSTAKSLPSCKGKTRRLSRQLDPAAARRLVDGRLACATPEKVKQGTGPRGHIPLGSLKGDSPSRSQPKPAPEVPVEPEVSYPDVLVRQPSYQSRRSHEEGIDAQSSLSPTLKRRKPFDKTKEEEKMDRIFTNLKKPRKRNASFEHELMAGYEFGTDDRRDQSCTLDYATGATACKPPKAPRGKSAEIRERAQAHGLATPIGPSTTKYRHFCFTNCVGYPLRTSRSSRG
jgi:hypothetical protein